MQSIFRKCGGSRHLALILLVICFSASISLASVKEIYVKSSASSNGNGESWNTAFNNLQTALDAASSLRVDVEIRVAAGTYTPDSSFNVGSLTDTSSTKTLRIIGGYPGVVETETPDFKNNRTVLSPSLRNDRSILHIHYFSLKEKCIIEGFHIDSTNGIAAVRGESRDLQIRKFVFQNNKHTSIKFTGEILRIDSSYFYSSHFASNNLSPSVVSFSGHRLYVSRSTFDSISGVFGGDGECINVNADSSSISNSRFKNINGRAIFANMKVLRVSNSSFQNIVSTNDGSAVYATAIDLHIDSSSFKNTVSGGSGGAVYTQANNLYVNKSIFENCSSKATGSGGGAIFVQAVNADIKNTTFNHSKALFGYGGALYARVPGNLTIDENIIKNSESRRKGGAFYILGGRIYITNTTFDSSKAVSTISGGVRLGGSKVPSNSNGGSVLDSLKEPSSSGGAIYAIAQNLDIYNGKFTNCFSADSGGAVFVYAQDVHFNRSTFTACSSGIFGGALFIGSGGIIENSTFYNNASGESGGAAFGSGNRNYGGADTLVISNCTFKSNRSRYGGAWTCDKDYFRVINTRFIDNTAHEDGGAINFRLNNSYSYYHYGLNINLRNSRFIGNTARNGGAISSELRTTGIISECLFDSSTAHEKGGVIYASKPQSMFSHSINVDISQSTLTKNKANFGAVSYGWNGRFINSVIAENHADSSYIIVGPNPSDSVITVAVTVYDTLDKSSSVVMELALRPHLDSLLAGPKLINTTLANNTSISGPAVKFANTSLNSIFWNNTTVELDSSAVPNHSFIQNWPSGNGTNNSSLNPRFALTEDHPYSLHPTSPAIGKGTLNGYDTTLYKYDIAGNARVTNDKIDIGAYQYHHRTAPCISALDSIFIPAGGSITIALDSVRADGSGVYVSCTPEISRVAWLFSPQPSGSVKVFFDLQTNEVTLVPSISYKPRDVINITIQAADPNDANYRSTIQSRIFITNPEFELCSYSLTQNDTSRAFNGNIKTKNNIYPMTLSQRRIYLFDPSAGGIANMQYIVVDSITQKTRPISMGGDSECGEYTFDFNATNNRVYNSDGRPSNRTLYEWAVDVKNPAPGSVYYRNNKAIRFILPITNGERVHYADITVNADFDGPLTTMRIVNSVHSQELTWDRFNKPLFALKLIRKPLGENAPKADTVSLYTEQTSYTSNAIEDSRTYLYKLVAVDLRGNTGISQITGTTLSGSYSISGTIKSIRAPLGTVANVRLFDLNDTQRNLLKDTTVLAGSGYLFSGLVNGSYLVTVSANEPMNAHPFQDSVTILRANRDRVNFRLVADSPIKEDGVQVTQLEGSGNLRFTVRTDTLYDSEKPVSVLLRWAGGESLSDTGSQLFHVLEYKETRHPGPTAVWEFIITRQQIQDSILSRGKLGFDYNVVYIDSRIQTGAPNLMYSDFRSGKWSYPQIAASSKTVLFAGQTFKKPQIPHVTRPYMSTNDANFTIVPLFAGTGLKAVVEFTDKDNNVQFPPRYFDISGYLTPWGEDRFAKKLDWNNTFTSNNHPNGSAMLSGLTVVRSSGGGNKIAPVVSLYENPYGQSITDGNAPPSMSWKAELKRDAVYQISFYVEDTVKQATTVTVTVDHGGERVIRTRTLGVNAVPGWYNFSSNPTLRVGSEPAAISLSLSKPAAISTFALCAVNGGASAINNFLNSIVSHNDRGRTAAASGFNLVSDRYYNMAVYAADRFGNRSDTVSFDSLFTKPNFHNGIVSLYQQPASGDLKLNILTKDVSATHLDSITFYFDGKPYNVSAPAVLDSSSAYTEVTLSREALGALLSVADFRRHTVYDSLKLVFSTEHTITFPYRAVEQLSNCNECYQKPMPRCTEPNVWIRYFNAITSRPTYSTCNYTDTFTYSYPVFSSIVTPWPGGEKFEAASQEYRNAIRPRLDTAKVTSSTITLTCNNLNTQSPTTPREQLSGNLRLKWEPGSKCSDSSEVFIPFGNRFTMQSNNWIAFAPSFESALEFNPGSWREDSTGAKGARHQWVDYDPSGSGIGGRFYPHIGVSIPDTVFNNVNRWSRVRNRIPYISMGIRLSPQEASQSEKFNLWVLPCTANGETSRKIYWGVNSVIAGSNDNVMGSGWVKGPEISLSEGDHTIELYMQDDGTGVRGIALSKSNAAPPFNSAALSRWGSAGFDLSYEIKDLPHNKDIVFTAQAIDRMGNISLPFSRTFRTKTLADPVPNLIVTPGAPLENGFYPSVNPQFTLSADRTVSNTLDLEAVLQIIQGGSATNIALNVVRTNGNNWSAAPISALAIHPGSGTAVSSENSYTLLARAIRNGAGAAPDSGNWVRYQFGVSSSSGVPQSIPIANREYNTDYLKFEYTRGMLVASDTILGDLEVKFELGSGQNPAAKLMMENVLITTETANGSHIRITDISAENANFAAYECASNGSCSKISNFVFPYGRFSIEALAGSLSLEGQNNARKIAAGEIFIYDDLEGKARLSGDVTEEEPVLFTRWGIIDTFYTKDFFNMKDVVRFAANQPGFNIRSCHTTFTSQRPPNAAPNTYRIRAAGAIEDCVGCGPFLNFEVLNPSVLNVEFLADDQLAHPMTIQYTRTAPAYEPLFSMLPDGYNYNRSNGSKVIDVRYRSWPVAIINYQFGPAGVQLTNFGIQPDTVIFPGSGFIPGFNGILITGNPNVNSGALHFTGSAISNNPEITLRSNLEYLIKDIGSVSFQQAGGGAYVLDFGAGAKLAMPTWTEAARSVYHNDFTDTITNNINTFVLGAKDIESFHASGDFSRKLGEKLSIDGTSTVTWAQRHFQVKVEPKNNVLFRFTGFVSPNINWTSVMSGGWKQQNIIAQAVKDGHVSLFSDLTINTLHARHIFNGMAFPSGYNLGIPSSGFDIVNTNEGVRVMLLAPHLDMRSFGAGSSISESIYNAALDGDGNLTSLSARIPVADRAANVLSRLNEIIEPIAGVEFEEIFLNYSNNPNGDEKIEIGADASIILGEAFRNIGLKDQKIMLDELTLSYFPDKLYNDPQMQLERLSAKEIPLQIRAGIGPKNLFENSNDTRDYIELISGGNGLKVDYASETLKLEMNNWTLRTTNDFPFKPLQNLSFVLDSLEYTKRNNSAPGTITKLRARAEWSPPNGNLEIKELGVTLQNVKLSLGYGDVKTDKGENLNSTELNGYFKFEFQNLILAGKSYAGEKARGIAYVFFDGTIRLVAGINFTDTIPVWPWMSAAPDIFIAPPAGGTDVEIDISNNGGLTLMLKMENVHLYSKDRLPVLNDTLKVSIDSLRFGFENNRPVLKHLNVRSPLNKTIVENKTFKLAVDTVGVSYIGDVFKLSLQAPFQFKLGDNSNICQLASNVVPKLEAEYNRNENKQFSLSWNIQGGAAFECKLAGFGFGAELKIANDTIGFKTAWVDMEPIANLFVNTSHESQTANIIGQPPKDIALGVVMTDVYWTKNSSGNWNATPTIHARNIKPTFNIDNGIDLLGLELKSTFDFTRLFDSIPGIGFRHINIKMSEKLGGMSFPTGFSVYITGQRPFIHPEISMPQRVVLEIPAIKLGDNFRFTSALMQLGYTPNMDPPNINVPAGQWTFRGKAGMNLGVVDPVEVDLALERPGGHNSTGIHHAILTIKLSKGARIPIGNTGFFISGFSGGLYDGLAIPKSASSCGFKNLPPGIKMDAAIFIEFESPDIAKGHVGFWAHLRSIEFGINGEIKALRGVATAQACAALYNNGRAFHGNFRITADLGLAMQGHYVVDIWTDNKGGNLTASASSKIGVKKGTLINKRFLKVPGSTKWFGELFTKLGKFSNNQNGFTTGVKFFGKSWGLGVVGGSFKIGSMSSYTLKPAPMYGSQQQASMIQPASMSMMMINGQMGIMSANNNIPDYTFESLGFSLRKGDILSVAAARVEDGTGWLWPKDALRIAYINGSDTTMNDTPGNYLSQAEDLYGARDSAAGYYEHLNIISRTWHNPNNDTLELAVVLPLHYGDYEYVVMAGLMQPEYHLNVSTEPIAGGFDKVTFRGSVQHFQNGIREIVKNGTNDVLLKQEMRMQFFITKEYTYDDSTTAYIYREIPLWEFEGYNGTCNDITCIPGVSMDTSNRTLVIDSLIWNSSHAPAGEYKFFAAVELVDYISSDEEGSNVVLNNIEEAMVLRDNPVELRDVNPNQEVKITVERRTVPVKPVEGFTVTGSEVTQNWNGEDESRTFFLRWKRDDNPDLAGYELRWYPVGNDSAYRETVIGAVDRYQITIPVLRDVYADNCDIASGENSNDIARMCSTAVVHFSYYDNPNFTFIITPFSYKDTTIIETINGIPDTFPSKVRMRLDTNSVTATATRGQNSTTANQGNMSLSFVKPGNDMMIGDTILVPLNNTIVLQTLIRSQNRADSSHASHYGELYAVVTEFNGNAIDSTNQNSAPRTGFNGAWFGMSADTVAKELHFSPIDKDFVCWEMFVADSSCDTTSAATKETGCRFTEESKFALCGGDTTSLLEARSHFGVYKVKVFAINNGRRGVADVYDSLFFRVVPAEPLLHSVSPNYLIEGINDSLRLRVSGFDTADSIAVVLESSLGESVIPIPINNRKTLKRSIFNVRDTSIHVDSVTNAGYEIVIGRPDSFSALGDGSIIEVSVRNRKGGHSTYSEKAKIVWFGNPETVLCPADTVTRTIYTKEFLGVFPRIPRVSTNGSQANDSVEVYFSNFYRSQDDSFFVAVTQGQTTATITDYVFTESGIKFRLPSSIQAGISVKYNLGYSQLSCVFRQDSAIGVPRLKAEYAIMVSHNTAWLERTNNGDPSADLIRYFTGITPGMWQYTDGKPYNLGESITLNSPDWITFVVTDRDGNNRQTFTEWVNVEMSQPVVKNRFGIIQPDVVYVGETLTITPASGSRTGQKVVETYCWRYGSREEQCSMNSGKIVIGPDFESPVIVETWYRVFNTNGDREEKAGPVVSWSPRLFKPDTGLTELIAFRLPSSSLIKAASESVSNYPLRLRADTSKVSWNMLDTGNIYFVNKEMVPLPFEIDNKNGAARTVDYWVKLDNINPGSPDNVVYLVVGDTIIPPQSFQSVWPGFNAVYHGSNDGSLIDASANGLNVPFSGNAVLGPVGSGVKINSGVSLPLSSTGIDNNSRGFSFSAWFKLDTNQQSAATLFALKDQSGGSTFSLSVMPDLSLAFVVHGDTLRGLSGTVERGVWLHAGVSYGWLNCNRSARVYVNGIKTAEKVMNRGNDPSISSGGAFVLAGASSNEPFAGELDEMRISTSPLSGSWFGLDYFTQRGRLDFFTPSKNQSEIVALSNPDWRINAPAAERMGIFTDNRSGSWKLYTLPARYNSSVMVSKPFGMGGGLDTVVISDSATVTVVVDAVCGRPDFLRDFTRSETDISVRDTITGQIKTMAVYEKFVAGGAISFGGSGSSCAASIGYFVLFDLFKNNGDIKVTAQGYGSQINPVVTTGDLLFSDREYTIDNLPDYLKGAVLVSTANAFKHDTSSSFVNLHFDRRAELFWLIDSSSAPVSIAGWERKAETVRSGNMGFNIYSRDFAAGNTSFSAPGTVSMPNKASYSFLVKSGSAGCIVENVRPSSSDVLCAAADTGQTLYTDVDWRITSISQSLRNKTLVRTKQADYTNNSVSYISFDLRGHAWIYVALDNRQTTRPSFMEDISSGAWSYTGYTLNSSDGGQYEIWRKFYNRGEVSFSGVRHGGESNNIYNYLFLVDEYDPEFLSGDSLIHHFTVGDKPFIDNENLTVYRLPPELDSLTVRTTPLYAHVCDTVRFTLPSSARIYLALPPDYLTHGTFIETEGWTLTELTVTFNRMLPPYPVYSKLFTPGGVEIPGLQCGRNPPVPGQFNYVIFIDLLETPVRGYRARPLAVSGIGGERMASGSTLVLRNLDVAYAIERNMESRSYRMSVSMKGAKAAVKDTLRVLSLRDNNVVSILSDENGDSTAVITNTSFSLPDLMPVIVNADSVKVNAIDLTTSGSVRVAIANKSDVPVNSQFAIILFEDNDGDFQYNPSVDTYLGQTVVNGIAANEYAVFEIPVTQNQSFPNRVLFAFVDAHNWVAELNKSNNIKSSGTTCERYDPPVFTADPSGYAQPSFVPQFRDTVVYCYLRDTNGDSLIDESDSLYIVYVHSNRLYAVNAVTGDSLWPSIQIDPFVGMKVRVDDFLGMGAPQIISGNRVYSSMGELIHDFSVLSPVDPSLSFDFNRDGNRDSIAIIDSCVTIWSGRDNTLLYVNPSMKWTGAQDAVTVGVLADIGKGAFNCYDFNLSYPRYSSAAQGITNLKIRVGNAGAAPSTVAGVKVRAYADTANVFDSTSIAKVPSGVILLGEMNTGELPSGNFEDLIFNSQLPAQTKRVWFVLDPNSYYHQSNRDGDLIYFDVE